MRMRVRPHAVALPHVCEQFGGSVAVKPEDRRNLVLGLVLHDKARDTLRRVRGLGGHDLDANVEGVAMRAAQT